ncbi:MAG TPA: hypothetical protein VGM94_02500 [Galbitalea sp.]
MTVANIADILIAIAVLGWVIFRQLTWSVVKISRLWRMPVILGIVGIVMLAQTKSLSAIHPIDIAILIAELILSLGVGTAMGRLATFRTRLQRPEDVDHRNGETHNPNATVIESRTGGLGAALWLVLIVVRVGIEIVLATYIHSPLLESTGTILLVLAANRLARAFIIGYRLERMPRVAA